MNAVLLEKYAELVTVVGANVGEGDDVLINSSLEGVDLARLVCEQCYKLGAKRVYVNYNDRKTSRLKFLHESLETITDIPSFAAEMKNSYDRPESVVIQILSEDPHLYDGVDPHKLSEYSKAADKAFKRYYDSAMTNKIRWTLCAVPCKEWAASVFPDENAETAVGKLWEMIVKSMRLDLPDSVAAWNAHQDALSERSKKLNEAHFVALEYKNSLGTALRVGLPEGYIFSGARERAANGKNFCANMPTEEIFSAPDRNAVDGVVYASMPLVHDGNVIDKFWLRLEHGKITDFGAEQGEEILRNIIESDEGSRYLGEVALVQYDSPIRALNTLFFNTLFDENASCHLAIGRAYPLIESADGMTDEQLAARGINFSSVHVDFMIGTRDLSIVGIKKDGTAVPVFEHGNFAF